MVDDKEFDGCIEEGMGQAHLQARADITPAPSKKLGILYPFLSFFQKETPSQILFSHVFLTVFLINTDSNVKKKKELTCLFLHILPC